MRTRTLMRTKGYLTRVKRRELASYLWDLGFRTWPSNRSLREAIS